MNVDLNEFLFLLAAGLMWGFAAGVWDAMTGADADIEARRVAIFKAGAEADSPSYPEFQGCRLGSMEACNFYDGYASTHPGFKNPYRRIS